MAQRSCCVPGCLVKLGDGVLLHRFPNPSNSAQIERFRTWVMKIGGDIIGEDNTFVYRNRKVCHRHFEEIFIFPNKKLTSLAIPSLHIPGVYVSQRKMCVSQPPAPAVECGTNTNTDLGLPSTSAQMDTCTPSETDVCKLSLQNSHTSDLPNMVTDGNIELPSTSAQDNSSILALSSTSAQAIPLRTGRKRILNPLTATEKYLATIISETKLKLRKSQNTRHKLKIQMQTADKIMKSSAYNSIKEKMTPAAQTFFNMQISQFLKKPTGRRFSLDEKILCLSLYKPCPKAYRLLGKICVLPKRKTLDTLLNQINLQPGINNLLFYHLKKRVDKLNDRQKYCCVIFDEMAISPGLSYDKKNDIIHGFTDNGEERSKNFSDHVCVFMVRGIFKKYKQPVAFSFCKGSTKSVDLSKLLNNIIKKLTDCKLKVVATVSDQGASNMAALNILMNATKAEYLRCGKNYTGGFFELDSTKIYAIYDPPHLMKGIRNNLLTKDLEFKENGKIKIASWSHIEALYKRGPGYKGVKLVSKLTAQHVIPTLIPKMRVKHCTQVFSETVGRTMGYMAEIGRLPKASTDTADLLIFFDRLFDSINGNYHKPQTGKVYRSAVTPRSPHFKLWYNSLPILKSMKFVTRSGTRATVPSLTSWIKSIEAFISLTKFLHSVGLKSLLLRNINQDPLENFFGAIRAHGIRNIMPSATAFINAYKSLLICNITSYDSVGANCEVDNLDYLQSLRTMLTESVPQPEPMNITIDEEHLGISEVHMDVVLENPGKKEKCAAVAYCSGWLIHVIKKKTYNDCQTCKFNLECDQMQDFHEYIKIKEYDPTKTWLIYPTRNVFSYFLNVENIVTIILESRCNFKNIYEYVEVIVLMHINFNFLTCAYHKDAIIKNMLKKSILFFIHNWCKDINQLLSGKITFWDENDEMKVAARNYYTKHCKKRKD